MKIIQTYKRYLARKFWRIQKRDRKKKRSGYSVNRVECFQMALSFSKKSSQAILRITSFLQISGGMISGQNRFDGLKEIHYVQRYI